MSADAFLCVWNLLRNAFDAVNPGFRGIGYIGRAMRAPTDEGHNFAVVVLFGRTMRAPTDKGA